MKQKGVLCRLFAINKTLNLELNEFWRESNVDNILYLADSATACGSVLKFAVHLVFTIKL